MGDPQADPGTPGGTLYVVATPIGNLGDVTLRALEVLKAVPLVAAEDTRVTRRLFARYEIATRLLSFHAKSGPGRLAYLLGHLRGGEDLAIVTDAGTPVVSDPGGDLVLAWAAHGGAVVAVPGASAVLAAVVSSGLAGARWGFEGFLPRAGRERKDRLARVATDDRATVLFEAPQRLQTTLTDLADACGADRQAAVCRELTKLHEQVVRAPLGDLVRRVGDGTLASRGEIVIVVRGGTPVHDGRPSDGATDVPTAQAIVRALVRGGAAPGEAARAVAAATGISRRRLYPSSGTAAEAEKSEPTGAW